LQQADCPIFLAAWWPLASRGRRICIRNDILAACPWWFACGCHLWSYWSMYLDSGCWSDIAEYWCSSELRYRFCLYTLYSLSLVVCLCVPPVVLLVVVLAQGAGLLVCVSLPVSFYWTCAFFLALVVRAFPGSSCVNEVIVDE
jgi:hypothetical protein